MSYSRTLYDNFEIFRKKIFQWERIFENRGAVREISTDFQSENGFELTIYRIIKFWSSGPVAAKVSPLPPYSLVVNYTVRLLCVRKKLYNKGFSGDLPKSILPKYYVHWSVSWKKAIFAVFSNIFSTIKDKVRRR